MLLPFAKPYRQRCDQGRSSGDERSAQEVADTQEGRHNHASHRSEFEDMRVRGQFRQAGRAERKPLRMPSQEGQDRPVVFEVLHGKRVWQGDDPVDSDWRGDKVHFAEESGRNAGAVSAVGKAACGRRVVQGEVHAASRAEARD